MSNNYLDIKKYFLKNFISEIDNTDIFTLVDSLGKILLNNLQLEPTTYSQKPFDFDIPSCVLKAFDNKNKYRYACQIMQILFLHILKSFNINCRPVVVFTNYSDKQNSAGHALIEFIDIKNAIYDPTFSCYYEGPNNNKLDSILLQDMLKNKNKIKVNNNFTNKVKKTQTFITNQEYLKKYYEYDINNYEKVYTNIKLFNDTNNNIMITHKNKTHDWKNTYLHSDWYKKFR